MKYQFRRIISRVSLFTPGRYDFLKASVPPTTAASSAIWFISTIPPPPPATHRETVGMLEWKINHLEAYIADWIQLNTHLTVPGFPISVGTVLKVVGKQSCLNYCLGWCRVIRCAFKNLNGRFRQCGIGDHLQQVKKHPLNTFPLPPNMSLRDHQDKKDKREEQEGKRLVHIASTNIDDTVFGEDNKVVCWLLMHC